MFLTLELIMRELPVKLLQSNQFLTSLNRLLNHLSQVRLFNPNPWLRIQQRAPQENDADKAIRMADSSQNLDDKDAITPENQDQLEK